MLCTQLSTRRKEENRYVFFFLSVISVTQTELCLNIGAHTRITRWVVRGSKTVRRNRTKIALQRKKKTPKSVINSVSLIRSKRFAGRTSNKFTDALSRDQTIQQSPSPYVIRRFVYTRDYFERSPPVSQF